MPSDLGTFVAFVEEPTVLRAAFVERVAVETDTNPFLSRVGDTWHVDAASLSTRVLAALVSAQHESSTAADFVLGDFSAAAEHFSAVLAALHGRLHVPGRSGVILYLGQSTAASALSGGTGAAPPLRLAAWDAFVRSACERSGLPLQQAAACSAAMLAASGAASAALATAGSPSAGRHIVATGDAAARAFGVELVVNLYELLTPLPGGGGAGSLDVYNPRAVADFLSLRSAPQQLPLVAALADELAAALPPAVASTAELATRVAALRRQQWAQSPGDHALFSAEEADGDDDPGSDVCVLAKQPRPVLLVLLAARCVPLLHAPPDVLHAAARLSPQAARIAHDRAIALLAVAAADLSPVSLQQQQTLLHRGGPLGTRLVAPGVADAFVRFARIGAWAVQWAALRTLLLPAFSLSTAAVFRPMRDVILATLTPSSSSTTQQQSEQQQQHATVVGANGVILETSEHALAADAAAHAVVAVAVPAGALFTPGAPPLPKMTLVWPQVVDPEGVLLPFLVVLVSGTKQRAHVAPRTLDRIRAVVFSTPAAALALRPALLALALLRLSRVLVQEWQWSLLLAAVALRGRPLHERVAPSLAALAAAAPTQQGPAAFQRKTALMLASAFRVAEAHVALVLELTHQPLFAVSTARASSTGGGRVQAAECPAPPPACLTSLRRLCDLPAPQAAAAAAVPASAQDWYTAAKADPTSVLAWLPLDDPACNDFVVAHQILAEMVCE